MARRRLPQRAKQLVLLLLVCQALERYPAVVQSGRSLKDDSGGAAGLPDGSALFSVMQSFVPPERATLTEHFATTEDGCVLRMFRLQRPGHARVPHTASAGASGRRVVFVQHALMDSSLGWLLLGPTNSLPFVLLDAGFDDVFLGNLRGNRFSRNSTRWDPDLDSQFWRFSYDLHAEQDIPAMLYEALRVTGAQDLQYIGYSQGSLVLLAGLSARPELASAVRSAVLLAPAVFVGHITSLPFKTLAHLQTAEVFQRWGFTEFGAYDPKTAELAARACAVVPFACVQWLQFLCGANPDGNLAVVESVMRHMPAGTSTQNMAHWGQAVRQAGSGPMGLRKFDFGTNCAVPPLPGLPLRRAGAVPNQAVTTATGSCNQQQYGQMEPPGYNFSVITTPLVIFSGGQDSLATPTDTGLLLEALPRRAVHAAHQIPKYAHLDFSLGDDAHAVLYPSVVTALTDLDLASIRQRLRASQAAK